MKTNGITTATSGKQYDRLLRNDILRLPTLNSKSVDYFLHTKQEPRATRKQTFLKSLFTVLTFGLTGLYLAHRNNLFNPIKRTAKKFINTEAFKETIKRNVDSLINEYTYKKVTRNFLDKMAKSVDKDNQDIAKEAKNILSNNDKFAELFGKVSKQLADDPDKTSLNNGFTVDVLNRLEQSLESHLTKRRNNGYLIKNESENWSRVVLEKTGNQPSEFEETLFEIITNRISGTIENFVKSKVSDAKFNNV